MAAALEMFAYAQALGEDRRGQPTRRHRPAVMMHAEVDGERLTRAGVRVVLHPARRRRQRDHAQRDQPRHAGAHRAPRPAQDLVRRLRRRHTKTAVEEIVRWATPVIHFRRTATEDTVHRRHQDRRRRQGRAVVQLGQPRRDACSPTRTSSTSRRPLQPQQVGFGAGGPHFCLGANLARREIAVMFDEIRRRLPDIADHRRARLPAEQLHQRHQAPALRLVARPTPPHPRVCCTRGFAAPRPGRKPSGALKPSERGKGSAEEGVDGGDGVGVGGPTCPSR